MKHVFYLFAAVFWIAAPLHICAQSISAEVPDTCAGRSAKPYGNQSGDLYQGFTRKLPDSRAIVPYGLEVSYHKTVHLIFPSAVRYIDLGSDNLIAGKADGAANVVRIKAAIPDFRQETNMSVITGEGRYYAFNVKYAGEPQKLSINISDEQQAERSVSASDHTHSPHTRACEPVIRLPELGADSPKMVDMRMQAVYTYNGKRLKDLSVLHLGIRLALKNVHTDGRLMYLHLEVQNCTNRVFDMERFRFTVADRKRARHTAMQETAVRPVRKHGTMHTIAPREKICTVVVIPALTMDSGKQLQVELFEKNGSRKPMLAIRQKVLDKALPIDQITGRR